MSANLDEADTQVGDDGADLVVVGGMEPHLLQLPLLRGWGRRWRGGWRRRWRRGLRRCVGLRRGRMRDLIRCGCGCSRGLCRRWRRRGGCVGGGGGGGRSGHIRVRVGKCCEPATLGQNSERGETTVPVGVVVISRL